MNRLKFYVTTPIYYVNDVPHLGHAYTTVAADVLARHKRMLGFDVHFLTGADEHGQKVFDAAQEKGMAPQEFLDGVVKRYKEAWKKLNISNDDFIRTTEARHKKVVQAIFSKLIARGDIYKGEYEGWYCVTCENFWTETSLTEDLEGRYLCPQCGKITEKIKEETYFFKLSKYQDEVLKHIEANPEFIQPISRRNEVINFIKQGLRDLSVTRTAFSWGVNIHEDHKHVVYVWFDALINYISSLGYPDGEKYKKFWPADVHLMGKEIVRFHAVIWPAMLMALEIPLPKTIFGHGWWTVEGKKMSKSVGNVVDPLALADQFGVDPVRYFILREVPFGVDGDFSMQSFKNRFNADLANDLGNLLHRSLNMIEKYFEGIIPDPKIPDFDNLSHDLIAKINELPQTIEKEMSKLAFSEALSSIWSLISDANKYIEHEAPWKLAKSAPIGANAHSHLLEDNEKLKAVLYNLAETLKSAAIFAAPFMPETASSIWEQLNLPHSPQASTPGTWWFAGIKIAGIKVKKGKPLFPRLT